MRRSGLIIAFLTLTNILFAQQKGYIRGNIGDGQFGGPLIGANVTIPALSGVGATTDFDGNYSITVEPGTYEVKVSYISFADQVFKDIVVKAGEVTKLDAVLQMASQEVGMVEVVATVRKNSEAGVLMDIKNATVVTDGLSAQTFRKVGDSDLSGAIRRVTGVTVQNGKYVYVRGLGDRYTKSVLNGMPLPGLDPDVNAVQINIFPTSVLENVSVSKTFSPDLWGDFTGGLVNVVTKKFPEEKTTQIGLSFTYVPGQHFNKDYILYTRSKTDFFGFDDGMRKLPIDGQTKIPDETQINPQLETITRSFNQELSAKKTLAFMNTSFNFNHGNQINKENGTTYGYNFVFRYASERSFYKGYQSNDYLKNQTDTVIQLERQRTRVGDVGNETVLWNALLTGSMKKGKSSYTAMLLYNQGNQSSASQRINQDFEQNQATLVENILTYSQRSMANFQLSGSHRVGIAELDWGNSFSYSRVYDPDFRETRISVTDGDTALTTGNGAGINRFWRNLNEFNETFRFDAKLKVHENISVKVGAAETYRTRDFTVFSYKHRPNNLNDVSFDPNWYLQSNNIWSADPSSPNYRNGTYTIGDPQPANQYKAQQNVAAVYLMAEQQVLKKLNLIYGLRIEHTLMYYTGVNETNTQRYLHQTTLNTPSFLPALNLVYKANDKMNLRAGYSRTIARPSFKEKSQAEIYDPITKRTFSGNIDLHLTNIDNADLRYEFFIGGKDMISLGGFYKRFDGHIELVSFETAPDNYKPRNSGIAHVFGGEFEIRKGLRQHTSSAFLQGFFLAANVTIVKSMVDMTSVFVDNNGKTELQLRQEHARAGETISRYRPMTGQSPYAVNASISYELPDNRGNISLAYNVQGDQLTIIGSGRVPDVYTIAFHSLNFNAYVNVGEKRNSRITLRVQNMINDDRTLVYRSYKAADQKFTSYLPGPSIRLAYQYTF
ncbi:MAG: TonB-dependent receptor plug domain-containing protein [Flavobacteriales bacterium]|nr:TonB-dependent receptor plug domain-containing protein [Flavobacteriales bacterium]